MERSLASGNNIKGEVALIIGGNRLRAASSSSHLHGNESGTGGREIISLQYLSNELAGAAHRNIQGQDTTFTREIAGTRTTQKAIIKAGGRNHMPSGNTINHVVSGHIGESLGMICARKDFYGRSRLR